MWIPQLMSCGIHMIMARLGTAFPWTGTRAAGSSVRVVVAVGVDVDDDSGHVVTPARVVGRRHERFRGPLRGPTSRAAIASSGSSLNRPSEQIRYRSPPMAGSSQWSGNRPLAAQCPGDDVPARVGPRLLPGDDARQDKFLHL